MSTPALPRVRRRRIRLAPVVVLTLVWVLLWNSVSVFLLLTGVLVAIAVGVVFPLPEIQRSGRVRPLGLARLAGRLVLDLVRSSLRVVTLVFARRTPRNAIIGVQLRSRSDLYLTQTAELVSLVPGTIVLEVHRPTSTLYLHVLDAVEPRELHAAVADVLDAEARVIRAFGSDEEIAALAAGRPQPHAAEPERSET